MKKIYSLLFLSLFALPSFAQSVCNSAGNLVIFTNYDGGPLNIDVDQNIPNLKIGVCSYEGCVITISGTYAANVTAVEYAGFNSTNPHCGSSMPTSISGAGSATTNIVFAPTATLSNANGYGMIICGYSCSTTTSQGGCNTVDQIEDYFLHAFPGSQIYSHKVQYGCWTGTQLISGGGTCCALATGINEPGHELSLDLFPNPANGSFTVYSASALNNAVVELKNTLGQTVYSQSGINGHNNNIDVSGLAKGVYLFSLKQEDAVFVQRICIE